MSRVYALSFHADYQCQRSGVCCTSEWDIPVELPLYRTLTDALQSGRLHAAASRTRDHGPLVVDEDLPGGAAAMVARAPGGDCVFYHRDSGLCVIQRDVGEAQLPSACRHFPRLAVRDRRGTFITLSHYCPTAAASLFRTDVPIAIVEGPAAFPPVAYEGLVVEDDAWPPLLHPRMLMHPAGYAAWESHMVARCADRALSPDAVIATLERDARLLRRYRPEDGSLQAAIAALPAGGLQGSPSFARSLQLFADVLEAVPGDRRPQRDDDGLDEVFQERVVPEWDAWSDPIRRYLAAKAFASWTAYQGRGILAIVRGLEAALAVLNVEAARQCRTQGLPLNADLLKEAFRQADLILNHRAVSEDLARIWSRVEGKDRNDGSMVAGANFPLHNTRDRASGKRP